MKVFCIKAFEIPINVPLLVLCILFSLYGFPYLSIDLITKYFITLNQQNSFKNNSSGFCRAIQDAQPKYVSWAQDYFELNSKQVRKSPLLSPNWLLGDWHCIHTAFFLSNINESTALDSGAFEMSPDWPQKTQSGDAQQLSQHNFHVCFPPRVCHPWTLCWVVDVNLTQANVTWGNLNLKKCLSGP